MNARAFFVIHGLVQGVGYRNFAFRRARQLGLTGFVRNRADGSVESIAEGRKSDLQQYLDWLRQGPAYADVQQVEAQWSEPNGEFPSFEVRF